MITRRLARCSPFISFRSRRPIGQCRRARKFSTSAPTVTSSPSEAAILGSITTELDKLSPRFDIHASQIQILESPSEFYSVLKKKILAAKNRIYLSTLYIGKTQHELIDTIRIALKAQPGLKVYFLTDALRGTRETPEPSCASLLVPLIAEFGSDRVKVRMYHTPNLTGLRKKWIPKRINEGWGLQHMKLYGIDDEIILSGANLSSDYFTNRQDRYHLFSSKEMTDYFEGLQKAVSSLSFRVLPDPNSESGRYSFSWPDTNTGPSPLSNPSAFIEAATSLLTPMIQPTPRSEPLSPSADTSVYLLAQLTPLLRPDNSTELPALSSVLHSLSSPNMARSKWMFTAGYFNIHPSLSSLLIASKSENGTVITASPWANGFYGSSGVSGMLPAAYSLLSRRFLERVQRTGRAPQISLREWRLGTVGEPGGWTYHAKGLWITLPNDEAGPSVTLVGSSNYTKRSYELDLEVNAMVVTKNDGLKRRLKEEQEWLLRDTKEVGIDDFARTERRVSIKVRLAMWIVSLVGGAL